MDPDTAPSNNDPGLPPVAPPSGKFIAQLFLVPGLIVAVAVLVLLSFTWLAGGETAPTELLNRLENENADIRWRAANELAQRLKRDDRLAANPQLALRLAELLRQRLNAYDRAEKNLATAEAKEERKTLGDRRKDIEFLIPCLGSLSIPVGVSLLNDLAQQGKGRDVKTITLLRRKAVWTLTNLGENLKRFEKLSQDEQAAVAAELSQEAEDASGERAAWAQMALGFVQGRQKKIGVITALAECARADDPFLRELVAHALTFWQGDAEEKVLAEETLMALSRDDGHGVRIEIGEAD